MPHDKFRTLCSSALLLAGVAASSASAGSATMCVDGPVAIEDAGAETLLTFEFDLPAGATVESVAVSLDIDHPWVGDLVAEVRTDARTVRVLDRVAMSALPFGCGGDDINAAFTDNAPAAPDPQCSPTAQPTIVGDVLPAQPLGAFTGDPAAGTWTLAILDAAQFDAGSLQQACVTIEFSVGACPADFNLDGQVGSEDLSQLLGLWGADCTVSFPCADLDEDNFVTAADLAILLGSWGPCN